MNFIIGLLTSRLAGPAASIAAVILLALCVGQCTRAVKAEHRADRAEKATVAVRRDLGTCRANGAALEAEIASQNAAVDAFKREGAAKVAEIAKARQATRQEAERADRAAAALKRLKPAGNDLCARMLAVDEAVKEIGR